MPRDHATRAHDEPAVGEMDAGLHLPADLSRHGWRGGTGSRRPQIARDLHNICANPTAPRRVGPSVCGPMTCISCRTHLNAATPSHPRRYRRPRDIQCRSSSASITSPATVTTGRSASAPRSSGCGRRRTAAPPIKSYSLKVLPDQSFRELAAGPPRQLDRPLRLSGKDHRVLVRGRLHRRHAGDQSVRLLRRALCRHLSVRISGGAAHRPRRLSRAGAGWAAAPGVRAHAVARADEHGELSRRAQPEAPHDGALRHPDGAGRADARRDPADGLGLVPRQRLAAGADHAPAGNARALRVGLSHPAQARSQAAGRPRRRHPGLHRPARLDRGLPPRRRLDRLRSDLRPVVRRGPSAGGSDAASPLGCADHRRRRRTGGGRFLVRDADQSHCREAAGHVSVFRRGVAGPRCARQQGR